MFISVRDLLRVKGDAVWYVSPETTVITALNTLSEKDIGALLVMEDGQIAGIVSERDVVRKISATNAFLPESPVSDYMTPDVITLNPSQPIEDCMALMTEQHIRHLPVIEDNQLVGMISIGDVIKAIITSQEFTIDQLKKYIDGGGYNQ
jgi:CBS domain-containing protein